MPVDVQVAEDHRLVFVRLAGLVQINDLLRLDEELAKTPKVFDLLVFESAGIDFAVSSEDLRSFAQGELVLSAESRRVIVGEDKLLFGLARMYALSARPTASEIRVCDSLAEAASVLDISVDVLEALATRDGR